MQFLKLKHQFYYISSLCLFIEKLGQDHPPKGQTHRLQAFGAVAVNLRNFLNDHDDVWCRHFGFGVVRSERTDLSNCHGTEDNSWEYSGKEKTGMCSDGHSVVNVALCDQGAIAVLKVKDKKPSSAGQPPLSPLLLSSTFYMTFASSYWELQICLSLFEPGVALCVLSQTGCGGNPCSQFQSCDSACFLPLFSSPSLALATELTADSMDHNRIY